MLSSHDSPTSPDSMLLGRGRDSVHHACGTIEIVVAAAFAVPAGELRAATRRSPSIAFARQSAMYLAHVAAGLTFTEIGRAFGRDRTTAAHACGVVEERREDPRIDAMFCALEEACASRIKPLASDREVGP